MKWADKLTKIFRRKKIKAFGQNFFQNYSQSVILEAVRRGGEAVTQESAKLPCKGSIPFRASNFFSMEKETGEILTKDETGFSEKQLDRNLEAGIFRNNFKKKKIKKILFEKKSKK